MDLQEMSQHSSNPLELPSSDARNKAALQTYRKARAMGGNQRDSDEPEDDLEVSDLKNYQRHIAGLLQDRPAAQAQYTTRRNVGSEVLIDLDEDMDCEKEQDYDGENSDEYDGDSGVDADAAADIDEEMTLYLKSREEQEEIRLEIADLEEAVPAITQDYKIIDRLGMGTFSSVYKAIDLGYHEKWDNTVWHGLHPAGSSAHYQSLPRPPSTRVFVAIKRIYVTSNPERIRNEISILETCRGARHVSQLITAFRHEDQVVAIMPYHPHEDFRVRAFARIRTRLALTKLFTVILPHTSDGWDPSVLQMHVSCAAGHSCAGHHPSRHQACQLSLRPSQKSRNASRPRPGLREYVPFRENLRA
jgi:cell division control protein 7